MSNSLPKSFAYFTGAGFVGTISQIIKGKLMAIVLGASGMGIYSQLTNLFNFLCNLCSLGFRNGVIKKIREGLDTGNSELCSQHYASIFVFLSLYSTAVVSLLCIFSAIISNLVFADDGARANLVTLILVAIPFAVMANFYRAMLSGHMAVKGIVRAQILADIISLLPFTYFLFNYHLPGALLAFIAYQCIKCAFYLIFFGRKAGFKSVIPVLSNIRSKEIFFNVRYGLSGLFLISLNLFVHLFNSRNIIAQLGEEQNGFFSVAFRVATVYMGAIYASSSSYYFPSLVKATTLSSVNDTINKTCQFYMYILPPVVIAIMCGGEIIIAILFSREFLFAAFLLLFFLPGDLLRVCSESYGLVFLAKERFLIYNSLFIIWAAVFLGLSWFLLKSMGTQGVALAYLIAHGCGFLLAMAATRYFLQISPSRDFLVTLIVGGGMVTLCAIISYRISSVPWRIVFGLAIVAIWTCTMSYLQPDFRLRAITLIKKVTFNNE